MAEISDMERDNAITDSSGDGAADDSDGERALGDFWSDVCGDIWGFFYLVFV